MYTFLLILLILDSLILMTVVLLQSGKGAGLSAEFGGVSSSTDSFMGGRQAATLLTKATWWTGGIFIALALVLAILSSRASEPGSILQDEFAPATEQQVPTPLLDQEAEEGAGQVPPGGAGQEGGDESGGGGSPEGGPPPGGN